MIRLLLIVILWLGGRDNSGYLGDAPVDPVAPNNTLPVKA